MRVGGEAGGIYSAFLADVPADVPDWLDSKIREGGKVDDESVRNNILITPFLGKEA